MPPGVERAAAEPRTREFDGANKPRSHSTVTARRNSDGAADRCPHSDCRQNRVSLPLWLRSRRERRASLRGAQFGVASVAGSGACKVSCGDTTTRAWES